MLGIVFVRSQLSVRRTYRALCRTRERDTLLGALEINDSCCFLSLSLLIFWIFNLQCLFRYIDRSSKCIENLKPHT